MIGPYFFENDDGTTVTVNSERYGYNNRLFLPAVEEYDLENMWFQQDGITCHVIRANMALFQGTCPGRTISRHGDINWPPKIMRFDIIRLSPTKRLWVYADKSSTFQQLKQNIHQVTTEIPPNKSHKSHKVIENYLKRINACNTPHGGHLNDVEFHT